MSEEGKMVKNEGPTPVSGFKKTAHGAIVDLPSGNKARIKNSGMQVFVKKGLIPDSLTPLVQKALNQHKEADPEELMSLVGDQDKLAEVVDLFDAIVRETWTEPKVLPIPEDEADRKSSLLYVDEIEFDDKVFTFQYAVGGVKDLESFRSQQKAMLERLSAS